MENIAEHKAMMIAIDERLIHLRSQRRVLHASAYEFNCNEPFDKVLTDEINELEQKRCNLLDRYLKWMP